MILVSALFSVIFSGIIFSMGAASLTNGIIGSG